MSKTLNVNHIEPISLIYGPGIRYVIWTQGCSIRCPGCWNKEMWSSKPKNLKAIDDILNDIKNYSSILEGITILGGEPFDQYEAILELVKKIRDLNLSIILYTGYELEELKEKNQTEIFRFIDVLITGRFIPELRTTSPGLIGSSNQKIIFFTNKYSLNDLSNENEIEISIDENGQISFYGYIDKNEIKNFL